MMDKRIEMIKKFRLFLLSKIERLSDNQLNAIPVGHNNNIIWNLGHLICAQQSLCYIRSGQSIIVSDPYFSPYMTHTKPEKIINGEEINNIKKMFLSTIEELQKDFNQKKFNSYTASENILKIYGVKVNNIEDTFEFLLYHEGVHSGYIISMMRLLNNHQINN